MTIFYLHVAIPQVRFTEPGGKYEVNEGAQFTLGCLAEVYPVTSLEWFRIVDSQPGLEP